MGLSHVELITARRQVNAEINADPVDVELRRRTKINDGAGGWKWSDFVPLKAQEVTIIPAKRRLSEMLVNTELGDVVHAPYIILGRHNFDVQRGDRFTWNGDDFVVKEVAIKIEVAKTCPVDYFGGGTNA